MFIIGITGGIGCGKSTAAQICREAGLPVIDADELSRQATSAGGSAMAEIIEKFGVGTVDSTGALDRQVMAKKVFQNHRALDQLSSIVHRHVLEQIALEVKRLEQKKTRAVVIDVPIPVIHGFLDLCDQVWVIWANEDVRLARLAGRGIDEIEARRRMAMQMTKQEYLDLADYVLDNDGSEADLKAKIRELLTRELGQRGIRIKADSVETTVESDVEPE